jgi:hypothetical protein
VAKASKRFRRCIVTVVEAGGEFFQWDCLYMYQILEHIICKSGVNIIKINCFIAFYWKIVKGAKILCAPFNRSMVQSRIKRERTKNRKERIKISMTLHRVTRHMRNILRHGWGGGGPWLLDQKIDKQDICCKNAYWIRRKLVNAEFWLWQHIQFGYLFD